MISEIVGLIVSELDSRSELCKKHPIAVSFGSGRAYIHTPYIMSYSQKTDQYKLRSRPTAIILWLDSCYQFNFTRLQNSCAVNMTYLELCKSKIINH